jgi:hypothetical protein
MRLLRAALAGLVGVAIPLMVATPAHGALAGPCEASGTLQTNGVTYNPKTVSRVRLPLSDDVAWQGAVAGTGRRSIAGKVKVKLPPPLPEVTLGKWSKPDSDRHRNNGIYHYSFPNLLGGYEIPLTGVHTEPGITCAGAVIIEFDGGGFSNPAVIGALILVVVSGVGIFIAMRPKVV